MAAARVGRASCAICVIVAVLTVASACTPIEDVDFGNRTYAPGTCGSIIQEPPADGYVVADGGVRHGDPAEADFYSLSVRPEIAYGDLTGDGLAEAALIVDCSTGNRPVPVGRIMTMHGTQATALAPVPKPPAPDGARGLDLATLQVADGTLIGVWIVLEANDPGCCPTGRLTTVYRWDGETFGAGA